MPLSSAQQVVADSDSRFRVLIAGRRFGKSFLSIRELARFASRPRKKVMYIAPTFGQAKQTIWEDLKGKLLDLRWVRRINESELTITLVNGSIIMLRSADNYDRMRGLGLDFVVFDEFADIKKEAWSEVISPALSDRQGHALFIGTPKGFNSWAKDLYDKGVHGEQQWTSYQFTTLDGGNVSQEEIEMQKSNLDARTFRQEYMATFELYQSVIYYNFGDNKVSTDCPEIDNKTVLHIGMDFNVSPLVAVVGVADPKTKKLYIVDEVEIYGSSTQEMCNELLTRYPNNKMIVYPDASGAHRHTVGDTDHNIIRQNGFEIKAPKRNPPVKDRINSVNTAFEAADGTTRLIVHPRCKRVIKCLRQQCYKEDTQEPDKSAGSGDHFNDALGYLVHTLMPVRRPGIQQDSPSYYGAV